MAAIEPAITLEGFSSRTMYSKNKVIGGRCAGDDMMEGARGIKDTSAVKTDM